MLKSPVHGALHAGDTRARAHTARDRRHAQRRGAQDDAAAAAVEAMRGMGVDIARSTPEESGRVIESEVQR
jgi:hypothetical protein